MGLAHETGDWVDLLEA
ncbi:uncharacterized protein G2W53_016468 [Senna tora]|uniref:Uncharacterized protein n=1 Tax=Senna tora TaxID=362788 RepID=A0A834WQ69_9FABA|nr:uncharacterized protein G2W53_016468 [Senna tora]